MKKHNRVAYTFGSWTPNNKTKEYIVVPFTFGLLNVVICDKSSNASVLGQPVFLEEQISVRYHFKILGILKII